MKRSPTSRRRWRGDVLLVASEAAPWAGTGGLGEVIGSMPRRLREAGWNVRIMLPYYGVPALRALPIRERHELHLQMGVHRLPVEILRAGDDAGTPLLLVACAELFDRPGLYGEGGRDYPDNAVRFAALGLAAAESIRRGLVPCDLLHAHDWQAGLAPVFLAAERGDDPSLAAVRTLLTIHNIAYQGVFGPEILEAIGLPPALAADEWLGHEGAVNYLKGGIVFSDRVSTVSPRHAREIVTPAMGHGLAPVLASRRRELSGILNGIDTEVWDPWRDPHLAARYDARRLAGKAACKRALQKELGLAHAPGRPLIGFLGRLVRLKGVDLLLEALPSILRRGGQVAVLGTGEPDLERGLSVAARAHPGQVAAVLDFNRQLAFRMQAGCDILTLPSRFEPCGLGQMQAMRYGTVPVVSDVGGLGDSVRAHTPGKAGTGFVCRTPTARSLATALGKAMAAYARPAEWRALQRRIMALDWSWDAAVPRYDALYRRTLQAELRRPPWPAWSPPPGAARGHEAPPEPFLDWGPDLPARYGEDAIRLLVQSPHMLYVYWEVASGRVAGGPQRLTLRLLHDGGRSVLATGRGEAGEWWIHAEPDRTYAVEVIDPDGGVLLRSHGVRTPRDSESPRTDGEWDSRERLRREHESRARRPHGERGWRPGDSPSSPFRLRGWPE